jgi:nucleotide-binding universal stress UspA family protein
VKVQRILVPLDGSRLAEAVLPAACAFARKLGASLVLLHVLEQEPPASVHGEPHLASADAARAYLAEQAERMCRSGTETEIHVHERPVENVAEAIDEHVREQEADLIAMCAHGRSGPLDRLLGTIAERILRGSSVPILLRTVRRSDTSRFELRKLLVPIDIGHGVEAALDAAGTLAGAFGASVTLLSVPEPASPAQSRLQPAATALARRFEEEDISRRLDELAAALRDRLPEVQTAVDLRRPGDAILAASESLPADLIVLVTHAHGGISGWLDPSVGQQLLVRPDLTLLLIRES